VPAWDDERARRSAVLLVDEAPEKPGARRDPDDENVAQVSQKPLDRLTTARQMWARWVTRLFQRSPTQAGATSEAIQRRQTAACRPQRQAGGRSRRRVLSRAMQVSTRRRIAGQAQGQPNRRRQDADAPQAGRPGGQLPDGLSGVGGCQLTHGVRGRTQSSGERHRRGEVACDRCDLGVGDLSRV
jgi:hypothetical protein